MKELTAIAASFGVSEPIFKAKLEYEGMAVDFTVKSRYRPNSTNVDPVYAAVAIHFSESYNKRLRRFEKTESERSAYSAMSAFITTFYVDHSKLKNPKQSTLWRWLRSIEREYNHPFNEGIIALFRYLQNNYAIQTFDKDNVHVKNAMAILIMMKEKYEV